MATNYSGGGDVVLTGFYNNLWKDLYRQQDTLAKAAEQKKKKDAEFDKGLEKQIVDINPDGLRPNDVADFYTDYVGKLKEIKVDIKNAKTDAERGTLESKFQSTYLGSKIFINNSKAKTATLLQSASAVKDGDEESQEYYRTYGNAPTKGQAPWDSTRIKPKLDLTETIDWENDAFKDATTTGDITTELGKFGSVAGNSGQFTTEVTNAKVGTLAIKLATQYQYSPSYKKLSDDRFPELAGNPKAMAEAIINLNRGALTQSKQGFINTQKSSGSGDEDNPTVVEVDRTKAPIPVGNKTITPDALIRISPTSVNLGGLKGYDIEDDSEISIPNIEGGVKIANIGRYPFIRKGVETTKNKNTGATIKRNVGGKLAQSGFSERESVDYRDMALIQYTQNLGGGQTREVNALVPVEDLPKDKKDIQKRIKALQSTAVQNKTVTSQPATGAPAQPTSKTFNTKYGSYTEAQLKTQYGDSWKQALEKIRTK